jgi:hypothetical protein
VFPGTRKAGFLLAGNFPGGCGWRNSDRAGESAGLGNRIGERISQSGRQKDEFEAGWQIHRKRFTGWDERRENEAGMERGTSI